MVLTVYRFLMRAATPLLTALLNRRVRRGKEDLARLSERKGVPGQTRPKGPLVWLHAASVGEAQSALILIEKLHEHNHALHILVTTGTVTSAALMAQRLPVPYAFHQYIPLDHLDWVARFLDHWQPDAALWLESELWPSLLLALSERDIPAALINGRLSPHSARRWRWLSGTIKRLLSGFDVILAQTPTDHDAFSALGAHHVITTGNLKYSAAPLPYDESELQALQRAIGARPVWLYASTHDGEEALAARIHHRLKKRLPDVLTIIVPRHPVRSGQIESLYQETGLSFCFRTENKHPPKTGADLYIADTMGELGLFYRLAPLACIGRSFSADGGGGHNPIEAAQLGCGVLHGPHVQNLQVIYDEMDQAGAALPLRDESDFAGQLERFLCDEAALKALQARGQDFAARKNAVLDRVWGALTPVLDHVKGHAS